MSKTKTTVLVTLSVTAFSGWGQDNNAATQAAGGQALIVTANRFPQPVSSVLAPVSVGYPRRYRSRNRWPRR